MIINFWKQIEVICGNHGDDNSNKMYLKQGPSSLFYACPKYYAEVRAKDELACVNRINLVDFEKILDKLTKEIEKGYEMGQKICLNNFSFVVKNIQVTVLKHNNDKIVVKVCNKKAIM